MGFRLTRSVLVAACVGIIQSSTDIDFKISRGIGSRGYDVARISVITQVASANTTLKINGQSFAYTDAFKYRWKNNTLHSSLIQLTSETQNFTVGDEKFSVALPQEGHGVRGLIFGDPCTEPGFVGCIHFNGSSMKERLPRLVNSMSSLDYRVILGDNFYDQDGGITQRFYQTLSNAAKQQWQITVPGNHDFWRVGLPLAATKEDQFGNGFMQFYAQDVAAADVNASKSPFNYSIDPDSAEHKHSLPVASNFFFYHKLGNVGFMGFSGAHAWTEQEALFREGCAYFEQTPQPPVVFLLGHYSEPLLGCEPGMDTPSVYAKVTTFPGCNHGTVRYLMGHTHCNKVSDTAEDSGQRAAAGYLLGGTGVRGDFMGCNTLGFAYVDTTGGRELVIGFELANETMDVFDTVVGCIERFGVDACLQFGSVWRNTSLPSSVPGAPFH
eukprot:m.212158 g.212158  ORF g.212158 m.212158 type:complete len:440 (-) comp19036_c0_seq2:81-1400(-)